MSIVSKALDRSINILKVLLSVAIDILSISHVNEIFLCETVLVL